MQVLRLRATRFAQDDTLFLLEPVGLPFFYPNFYRSQRDCLLPETERHYLLTGIERDYLLPEPERGHLSLE